MRRYASNKLLKKKVRGQARKNAQKLSVDVGIHSLFVHVKSARSQVLDFEERMFFYPNRFFTRVANCKLRANS